MHDDEDDSRYLTIEQQRVREEARWPWWKRVGRAMIDGCTFGAIAMALTGLSSIWFALDNWT